MIAAIKQDVVNARRLGESTSSQRSANADDAKTRLTALASSFNTSAAYDGMQALIVVSLRNILDETYDVRELNTDWSLYSDDIKQEIGEGILSAMCELQSGLARIQVPPPKLVLFREPRAPEDTLNYGSHTGDYRQDPSTYYIRVNLDRETSHGVDFPEFLNTMTHEGAHHLQKSISHAQIQGHMPDCHALRSDAILFMTIADKGAYIPAEICEAAYRAQPGEADAWRFGNQMGKFARTRGKRAAPELSPLVLSFAVAVATIAFASTKRPSGSGITPEQGRCAPAPQAG